MSVELVERPAVAFQERAHRVVARLQPRIPCLGGLAEDLALGEILVLLERHAKRLAPDIRGARGGTHPLAGRRDEHVVALSDGQCLALIGYTSYAS